MAHDWRYWCAAILSLLMHVVILGFCLTARSSPDDIAPDVVLVTLEMASGPGVSAARAAGTGVLSDESPSSPPSAREQPKPAGSEPPANAEKPSVKAAPRHARRHQAAALPRDDTPPAVSPGPGTAIASASTTAAVPVPDGFAAQGRPVDGPKGADGRSSDATSSSGSSSKGRDGATSVPGRENDVGGGGAADPMAAYLAMVRQKIEQEIFYPDIARKLGLTGKVEMAFYIGKDGSLSRDRIEVVGGSEDTILRDAALETIRGIDKFPPPPAGAIRVTMPVSFILRKG